MNKYASNTTVSVGKSKNEIEKLIIRFGAKQFMTGIDGNRAFVCFVYENRAIKREIALPLQSDFAKTPAGRKMRSREDMIKHWEQACRRKWRALALSIKGKLVSINEGIANFEDEFLAYTCLPSGETVSDWLQPQIDKTIESGKMPKLLVSVK
jgi:hypothetical protein